MLTVSRNRMEFRGKVGVGLMTQVIETESGLLERPELVHSIVLRFVASAIEEHSAPIKRALLEWYADTARKEELPDSIPPKQFMEFVSALGPRPRRRALLSVLRDLVEMGCLEQSIEGFELTTKGEEILQRYKIQA